MLEWMHEQPWRYPPLQAKREAVLVNGIVALNRRQGVTRQFRTAVEPRRAESFHERRPNKYVDFPLTSIYVGGLYITRLQLLAGL